jgi:proteasome lid subunit RPN8/RPN11
MEDFRLPEDLVNEITQHFVPGIESCGFIFLQKGKIKYVPTKNVSDTPVDSFIIDPKVYSLYSLKGDILYTVHTHLDNTIPSEYDLSACNAIGIPYIIFNSSSKEYSITYPKNYKFLLGRDYTFGEKDCFEAARDWYFSHNVFIPKRELHWKDDWWLLDEDYLGHEISNWPFKKVTDLQYGDLLTFSVEHEKENHIGVYLDQDIMFHHAYQRLSCRENIYPFWGKFLRNIYRYETCNITRTSWR